MVWTSVQVLGVPTSLREGIMSFSSPRCAQTRRPNFAVYHLIMQEQKVGQQARYLKYEENCLPIPSSRTVVIDVHRSEQSWFSEWKTRETAWAQSRSGPPPTPARLTQAAAHVIQRSRKKRKILMLKFLGASGKGTLSTLTASEKSPQCTATQWL